MIFFFLSLVGLWLWFSFSYPQLEFVNFSIDRKKAVEIAENYLSARGVKPQDFLEAAVFETDEETNRYLQRTLGFQGLIQFVRAYDVDLFYWVVRFLKENEKEGYKLFISSATGEIIFFQHTIDESDARAPIDREMARKNAIEFLSTRFLFALEDYTVKGDLERIFDNRTEYSFSWQNSAVGIPWTKDKNDGLGRLLMSVKVSGDEILGFSKNAFLVPERFDRQMERIQGTGRILSTVVRVFHFALFTSAIFFVIVRRNHLAMHTTKRFYIGLMIFSFILSLGGVANQFQQILFNYNTAMPLNMYLGQLWLNAILSALFVSVAIFMPSLAGETLRYQFFRERNWGGFLHYLHSTFFSRAIARSIVLGYCVCVIMLGIQSLIIWVGQRYWGVWIEHTWMNNLSTAHLPFLAAFIIGFTASFTEELMYRLFAISWGKMIFKHTLAAVIFSSLIWGFSHAGYPVFPMWFRGVEVTCLGLFLSFVYLNFGIIPVIVGHYLFDVFWNCSEYLFGTSQPFYYINSFGVLLLPLVFAFVAFIINKKELIRPMRWHLNKHQLYNLDILKAFIHDRVEDFRGRDPHQIKEEISSHGWDVAVVEVALEDMGILKTGDG